MDEELLNKYRKTYLHTKVPAKLTENGWDDVRVRIAADAQKKKHSILLPGSMVLAGLVTLIVAVAIYGGIRPAQHKLPPLSNTATTNVLGESSASALQPLSMELPEATAATEETKPILKKTPVPTAKPDRSHRKGKKDSFSVSDALREVFQKVEEFDNHLNDHARDNSQGKDQSNH